MEHVALFAGMGGFIQAADNLDFNTSWANELDSNCCDVLKLNFPSTFVSEKSIKEITSSDLKTLPDEIDLLTAGFPCQSFSVAAGGATGFEDDRGKLFFEIPRIIASMKSPPKVVLLENVPNIKVFDKGSWLKVILNEMRFSGYWVKENHSEILSAEKIAGSPQTRERLFIVCCHKEYFKSNPFKFSSVKKQKPTNVFDIIDLNVKYEDDYYLQEDNKYFKMIKALAKNNRSDKLYQIRRVEARACKPGKCPTLTANMGDGGHNVPFVFDNYGLRRLHEDECMIMQGFDPKLFLWPESILRKQKLRMIGNAVNVDLVELIMRQIKEQLFNGQFENDRRKHDKVAVSA